MEEAARGSGHRDADRLLVAVARHGGPWLVVLAVTALAIAAAETALPAVMGRAFDAVVGDGPRSWVSWFGLLLVFLVVCEMLDDLAVGATTARSTSWLRRSVLRHVLAMGPRRAERFSAGDVVSRLVGNAADSGEVARDLVRAVANLVPGIGGAVALALIDPWLCLTFLAGLPVLAVLLRTFARDASDAADRYLEVQGTIAGRLVDALSGARTIAAAGTVDREVGRVLAPVPELHRHGMGMWRAQTKMAAQDALVVPLLEILVLAVAGVQLVRGRLTPGEMLAAGQYVVLATTVGSAVDVVGRLARARAGAGRAAEVLGQPPMPYGTARLPAGPGEIEFRAVTVRAGGAPVLDGLDLVVPGGALVAVVGPSGAGKSLLAALAGRLIDPDQGEVRLDGMALPLVDRHQLRQEVTYGFERPALIGDTLADVIAFGARTPAPEEVVAAARAAEADAFIRRMPDGYRTRLADAPMSGGEVQRLGLARAFAHAGRVVILDDVAASLDTVTEHHVRRVLTGELGDRTRLVVAHRASTATRADVVVWLDSGRVRGVGPHHELRSDPDYRALFDPAHQAGVVGSEP